MLLQWVKIFPGFQWSFWIVARLQQLSSIRLIHIDKVASSVTVRLIRLRHNLAILNPLHRAATDLHLQLEEVSTSEDTAIQVIKTKCCCSQIYVFENHRLEGDLGGKMVFML